MSRRLLSHGSLNLASTAANGLDIGPDSETPERVSYGDVLLVDRVRAAIAG